MIITDAKNLLKQVQLAGSVTNTSSIMPIATNLLFETQPEGLYLYGTDLHTSIRVLVKDIAINEEQSFAVPYKTLLDLLKSLKGDISLEVKGNTLHVKAPTGKYKIGIFAGEDFPKGDYKTGDSEIRAYMLEHAVDLVQGAVSTDELRPVMTGIHFDNQNGMLAATDGHRMVTFKAGFTGENFTVAPKPLAMIKGFQDAKVNYVVDGSHIYFNVENLSFKVRLIDGAYPPYQKVIPVGNDKTLSVDQKTLLDAVKRVSLFSNSETKQIKLSLGETIEIDGSDVNFNTSAKETVEGTYEGDPIEIGLNAKYLVELLNKGDGDIKLTFSEPNKPVLIYNKANPNLLQLVMPVML